ncbi:MAG: DUF1801 domain-containing protein [Planctomycetes bacterium]|nr:DUF1801 domain-containing protein [Planctomycetota bacterium]
MATAKKKTAKKPAKKAAKKAAEKTAAKGPRKMKAFATFDLYLAEQQPPQQRLIRALRKLVARAAPELQEGVKWGNGCWLDGKAPIAYVYAAPGHVQLGFVNGARLDDPKALLRGAGRYVRHVPVAKPADIDEGAFAELLRQAVALGHPAFGR